MTKNSSVNQIYRYINKFTPYSWKVHFFYTKNISFSEYSSILMHLVQTGYYLEDTQMNGQFTFIQDLMLYMLELGHNAVETIKILFLWEKWRCSWS